jgi:spore maturation protein CgeB
MPRQQMPNRPLRVKLKDELGRYNTLTSRPENYRSFGRGAYILLLGLGPQPEILARQLPSDLPVFYLETAQFSSQMPEHWAQSIPRQWKKINPEQLCPELISKCRIIFYQFAPRIFPSFWQPLIAKCRLIHTLPKLAELQEEIICLPAAQNDLLAPELYQALTYLGYKVISLPAELDENSILDLLKNLRPQLFLSVNFRGLDAYGHNFQLLKEAEVPVAVWCVDNPFHLLSGLKSPFWRETLLFVTDSWFKAALREHGARHVFHLPLATSPGLFYPKNTQTFTDLKDRLVFVGRTAFPQKKGFFAASKVGDNLLQQAKTKIRTGERPDFAWWQKRLQLKKLWPLKQIRQAGFGAESSSQLWRSFCLQTCAHLANLTVYGDENWADLLPRKVQLREPVDYYGPLADIYASAAYNLNLTSMLLPQGLTQRHFDVWSAGGFLLTDFTPGLEIFPRELTRPICFKHPQQLSNILENLEEDPNLGSHLKTAWQDLMRTEHTYLQRAEYILKISESFQGRKI